MTNNIKALTLKTSRMTNKSWLVDCQSKRCSGKFKVKYQEVADVIIRLITDEGSILYSIYNVDYKKYSRDDGFWAGVNQLIYNRYLVCWRGMCSSKCYFLFDEKLQRVSKFNFSEYKELTDKLLGVRIQGAWGILDIVSGEIVQNPSYSELEVRDGKIIGKIRELVETECEVNV